MGNKSAPPPDPNIAIQSQEEIDLAKQQYADQQALVEKYSPMFDQQMQLSLQQQTSDQAHAQTLWDNYEQNTLPMVKEFQDQARDYNTEGRRTQAAQEVEGAVATQYDNARQQQQEQMNAGAVQPGSGKALALQQQLNLSEAVAKAGAGNAARRQTEAMGLSLEGQAINVGQGMPAMGLQQQAAGQQAGGQAQGSIAGLSGLTAAPEQYAFPGMTAGINGLVSYNNLEQQRFATQTSFLKDAMSAGAMTYGMYRSSKDSKVRKGPAVKGLVADPDNDAAADAAGPDEDADDAPPPQATPDDRQALKGLTARGKDGKQKMPVDRWKYKKGEGDGGEHIGPYAEDVHRAFGDKVAPGGKGIHMPAMNAKVDGAERALVERVAKLRAEAKRLGV